MFFSVLSLSRLIFFVFVVAFLHSFAPWISQWRKNKDLSLEGVFCKTMFFFQDSRFFPTCIFNSVFSSSPLGCCDLPGSKKCRKRDAQIPKQWFYLGKTMILNKTRYFLVKISYRRPKSLKAFKIICLKLKISEKVRFWALFVIFGGSKML